MTDLTDVDHAEQDVVAKAADENLTDAELDTVAGGFIAGTLATIGVVGTVTAIGVGIVASAATAVKVGLTGKHS